VKDIVNLDNITWKT